MNDEQLFERRHRFLTQRLAGGTFRVIAERHNKAAVEAVTQAGRPADEAETVTATTVRKDVERAKAELIESATRDMLRGEHRAILLDMRRANYAAMASGDVDAAKVVMSTLQREAEMFGLDEPKRTQIGVGTDVEFATDLADLIRAVGYQPPSDLLFAARGEAIDSKIPTDSPVSSDQLAIEAEVVPFDLDAPEPAAAAHGVASEGTTRRTAALETDDDDGGDGDGGGDDDDETWSNL